VIIFPSVFSGRCRPGTGRACDARQAVRLGPAFQDGGARAVGYGGDTGLPRQNGGAGRV